MSRKKRCHETKHHIIARSRSDEGYLVNIESNIKKLNSSTHIALHSLFSNKTPQEQLKMMFWINKEVINGCARELIEILIELEVEKFYKDKFLK